MHTQTRGQPLRSLYTYPWDVFDTGVSDFVAEAQALNLNGVTLATSYHAGKFIRPHARQGAVVFPEDGVVYFEPQAGAYEAIQPVAHSNPLLRQGLDALLADGRLAVHGWTVLLHNSRLGTLFPHYTCQNAFDESYVYSLCPMQPAVMAYAVNLCRDLGAQYPLDSLVLETPGWLPFAHGYHHEFAQVRPNVWLDGLLGTCFCPACLHAFRLGGLDAGAIKTRTAARIRQYFAGCDEAGADQAAAWISADLLQDDDWRLVQQIRQQRVTELVQAIRQAVPARTQLTVIPTVQRPTAMCWQEGSDLAALAQVADRLEIPFYEPSAARVVADAMHCLTRVAPDKVRAILRPGTPDLGDGRELGAALQGLAQLGVTEFAFYNYGLLGARRLAALGQQLAHFTG